MSSIGNITQLLQPAVPPVQIPVPAPASAAQATVIASSAVASSGADDQVDINNAQAVKQALQPKTPIANPEILGTGTFSMFTVGNVLYTRQTNRTPDGTIKVTYVPQYPIISSGNTGGGLDITA